MDKQVLDALTRVIKWEMDAQIGLERPVDQIPNLIADSLLDYFDIKLIDGARLPG